MLSVLSIWNQGKYPEALHNQEHRYISAQLPCSGIQMAAQRSTDQGGGLRSIKSYTVITLQPTL